MIRSEERRWLFGFIIFLVVITSIPYFVGFANAGAEWRFSGFFFGVEDGNSYIAKMLAGEAGDWLFRTPYTTFPQSGVFTYFPYILLGKLAAAPGLHDQLVVLYHLFRVLGISLYAIASYEFLAFFLHDVRFRRLGVALLALGGGSGWLLVLLGQSYWLNSLPLEFYSPESFGFLSIIGLPHLAVARALLLWGLLFYLKICQEYPASITPWKTGIWTGLLWLILGLMQPLYVVVGWFLLGLHIVLTAIWRRWKRANFLVWKKYLITAIIAVLISAPLVVYTLISFYFDPYLKNWSNQNIILSPNPLHYLLAYGMMLPFAVLGAKQLLRQHLDSGLFFVGWLASLPFLAYFPFNLQRRLPEGIWTAWVLLAMIWLVSRSVTKVSKWSYAFILAIPSTLIFTAGGFLGVLHPLPPVFVPAQEAAIFMQIQETVPRNSIFLSSFETGNQLPAWSPVRVVIGHGPESANVKDTLPLVEKFYDQKETDQFRQDLLAKLDIQYVFWGPSEKKLGGWDPRTASFLREVNSQGEFTYFAVAH